MLKNKFLIKNSLHDNNIIKLNNNLLSLNFECFKLYIYNLKHSKFNDNKLLFNLTDFSILLNFINLNSFNLIPLNLYKFNGIRLNEFKFMKFNKMLKSVKLNNNLLSLNFECFKLYIYNLKHSKFNDNKLLFNLIILLSCNEFLIKNLFFNIKFYYFLKKDLNQMK